MRVFTETDKAKSMQYGLLNPHYTDGRFRNAQTVFLAPGFTTSPSYGVETVEGASYDYSDRIDGWFESDKREAAWKAAQDAGHAKDSAAIIEAYLQGLYEAPDLQLVHIVAGVNVGNGYPYRVYGYIRGKAD